MNLKKETKERNLSIHKDGGEYAILKTVDLNLSNTVTL